MSPRAAPRTPRPHPLAARAPIAPAQITLLSAWRPIIRDACGVHTTDVYAVAFLLHDEGPQTTQGIMTALGQTQRDRIDRATGLGCEIGLFTRTIGAHNLRTYAVVSTPPPGRPPVYPPRGSIANPAAGASPWTADTTGVTRRRQGKSQ